MHLLSSLLKRTFLRHNLSKSPLYVYSSDQISTSSSCLHSTATNYTTCGVQRVKDARSQMLARRKVAKMLIAVVVVFGICFLPVHLLNILRSAKRSPQFAPRRARLQQNKSASTLVPRTAAWRCPLCARVLAADSRHAAPAAVDRYLPPAPELQHTNCTSRLLSIDETDGETDTVPLHRRLPIVASPIVLLLSYGRCSHIVRNTIYVTVGRPSVCLSHRSTASMAAGVFAAEYPVDRIYRSIAADALRALCCRRRCSSANVGSVMLRADEGGSTQTCLAWRSAVP